MDFSYTKRTTDLLQKIRQFMEEDILPLEAELLHSLGVKNHGSDWKKWEVHPKVELLKAKAKSQGLWSLFLPENHGGQITNLEYSTLAEEMGRSMIAPPIFNCNAPDTGNMEVFVKYGSDEMKEQWLKPLMDGTIRSAFCMTEPDVASSDATNMKATAKLDGDEVVLNGKKWWTTGIGHPNCKVIIFMGLTHPDAHRREQHSMVVVPVETPGVEIVRMLSVFGDYDEPYGHGEVHFNNVRVPAKNIILGPGRGFEIAQGRLGPGRIHHCMRCIGAAERALELMIKRGLDRTAFGKQIIDLGGNHERIANCRVAIDQARLLTLHAAWKIDNHGVRKSIGDISAIKIAAPNMLQMVVDEAIQMFGGMGVSHDSPLSSLFLAARTLRLADGPDAVHRSLLARYELKKYR